MKSGIVCKESKQDKQISVLTCDHVKGQALVLPVEQQIGLSSVASICPYCGAGTGKALAVESCKSIQQCCVPEASSTCAVGRQAMQKLS